MTMQNAKNIDKAPEQDPIPSAKQEAHNLQHDVAANQGGNTSNANNADSGHMGASEEQVIPLAPPTDALEGLMDKPSDDDQQTANDELTPG